jgi:hypothetical protein
MIAIVVHGCNGRADSTVDGFSMVGKYVFDVSSSICMHIYIIYIHIIYISIGCSNEVSGILSLGSQLH